MPRPSDETKTNAPASLLDTHAAPVSGNGGAGQVGPDGEIPINRIAVLRSKPDFPSDDVRSSLNWTAMKRWTAADIAKVGQDAVDKEVKELARHLMGKSWLMTHPMHKARDSDLGLWKSSGEFTKHNGKILVRKYCCPMWYRFNCDAEIRIQEGPGGLLMERRGIHDELSHADPEDPALVTRFIKGKRLIPEQEIPEAVEIRHKLGQAQRASPAQLTAVEQHRRAMQHRVSISELVFSNDIPELVDSDDEEDDKCQAVCQNQILRPDASAGQGKSGMTGDMHAGLGHLLEIDPKLSISVSKVCCCLKH
jgi:hypothetical protein